MRIEPGPAKLDAPGLVFSFNQFLSFIDGIHHAAAGLDIKHQYQVGQIRILNIRRAYAAGRKLLGRAMPFHCPLFCEGAA